MEGREGRREGGGRERVEGREGRSDRGEERGRK